MRFKDTATVYPPRGNENLQKITHFFGRQSARVSQSSDQASKNIQIPPPKPKFEIGSTKSEDNPFAHYYNDIIEHPNRQIRLSFRFGNNNSCVFPLKKFELHGNQFIPTEILSLNHREIHHLYKTRYYVANKCETIRGNYNVQCIHP